MIIAFTKYDLLFNEYHRKAAQRLGKLANADTTRTDPETSAKGHLDALINAFQRRFKYVTVSTQKGYPGLSDTFYQNPTRPTRPLI